MNIVIRNVDSASISKIDEIVKKLNKNGTSKTSREAYLRSYINSLAVLPEMKDLEQRYFSLVKDLENVINMNTNVIKRFNDHLEENN